MQLGHFRKSMLGAFGKQWELLDIHKYEHKRGDIHSEWQRGKRKAARK